jgi:Recombinase
MHVQRQCEREGVWPLLSHYFGGKTRHVGEGSEGADTGIVSKGRTASDGSRYGGRPIARGALYLMLQNGIYRGKIVHKGKSYPGEHEAIVDETLWNDVQTILSQNRPNSADALDCALLR